LRHDDDPVRTIEENRVTDLINGGTGGWRVEVLDSTIGSDGTMEGIGTADTDSLVANRHFVPRMSTPMSRPTDGEQGGMDPRWLMGPRYKKQGLWARFRGRGY
jgi:hypothetical protein